MHETLNGIEMYYEVHGEGEPLLFLHGFTGCGSDWRYIGEELGRGYRLLTPDVRGHGRSTNPAGTLTHRQVALDVFALLDRLGIARFKAIGLSLGGNALLHMATQQPDRIEAMVLVSATPYFPESARAIMRQMTVESHTEEDWRVMRQRHPQGDEQIRMLWRQQHELKDSYDDMNFTPPYLSTITARTLIVYGDRDPLYPVDLALQLRAAIPRSSLWVVPNGGHVPVFLQQGPRFIETAHALLRGEWPS